MSLNKRLMKLWFRNVAIAVGLTVSAFALAFSLLLLNAYFGSEIFSIAFLAVVSVVFVLLMCYKVAQEQYEREQIKSKRLMDTLKQENL